MPTYEYACKSCGQHLEVVQSFSDASLTECPHCHGELRKVFSAPGIAFKGSGFYKNDSRGASPKSGSNESTTSTETTTSTSTSTSTETSAPTPAASTTETKPASVTPTTSPD